MLNNTLIENRDNKVAVVMSIYNGDNAGMLKDAVDSILQQDYPNFCFFIYCDGFVDGEVQDILQDIEENNNVVVVRSEENHGLAVALNNVISFALNYDNFSFIARMDSDDISRKTRITEQVDFMNTNPDIDVSGTACSEFGSSFAIKRKILPTTHEQLVRFSISRCPFIHPTVMFRSRVFHDGFRYPVDTDLTEDMAFWFLLLDNNYKFGNLSKVLLDYRLSEDTIYRRRGVGKAYSEFKIRFYYMVKLRKLTISNIFFILSRWLFHLAPAPLIKQAYKRMR